MENQNHPGEENQKPSRKNNYNFPNGASFPSEGNQNLTSIEKALLILHTLGEEPFEYKSQELAKKLGFNRSTTYRILKTLEQSHMVLFDESSERFKTGPEMYHIGVSYLYHNNYHTKLQDILVEISELTKESVGMAVKEGDQIISIFEIEINQPMKLNDVPGKYFPINKGNYGKCIMAFQEPAYIEASLADAVFEKTCPKTLTTREELLSEYAQIRKQGYSLSIDELGIDIIGAGVPLFGSNHKIKACVAVAFFRTDDWEEKLTTITEILFRYKQALERYLP